MEEPPIVVSPRRSGWSVSEQPSSSVTAFATRCVELGCSAALLMSHVFVAFATEDAKPDLDQTRGTSRRPVVFVRFGMHGNKVDMSVQASRWCWHHLPDTLVGTNETAAWFHITVIEYRSDGKGRADTFQFLLPIPSPDGEPDDETPAPEAGAGPTIEEVD